MVLKACIVTTAYRPKRPPKKRKAVAITVPAIVRKRSKTDAVPPPPTEDRPTPANDDRKPPRPGARKPAIVATVSRKRTKLRRAEEQAEPDDDPEATARMRAFLARMIRPRG
jgi:hypothetical protein